MKTEAQIRQRLDSVKQAYKDNVAYLKVVAPADVGDLSNTLLNDLCMIALLEWVLND